MVEAGAQDVSGTVGTFRPLLGRFGYYNGGGSTAILGQFKLPAYTDYRECPLLIDSTFAWSFGGNAFHHRCHRKDP